MAQNLVDYLPFPCKVTSITDLTAQEKLFRFERIDGKPFNHRPGQFMQVSIVGIGEAPISVSSSLTRGSYLEMGVRKIGALTTAMHELNVGDKLGMRGAFGTWFPLEELRGKELILIAGGCGLAPLRSLIQYVEDRPKEFAKATIVYGAKSQDDVLYKNEIYNWQYGTTFDCLCTVDAVKTGTCWDGNVGLITTLIPKLSFDSKNTVAVICGPPIMYKFVLQELFKKGLTPENIVVSLERHMKCGVGKCGHCTIDHLYCCMDGPVFWLSQIKDVANAL
ncbi:MAG: FAD/NAD(P)-binding protein [Gammaproteobacteria bacterium]|nr:FAD/NAD(P)-binding protein [Gammaproteobacteria bacterium]